MLEEAHCSQVLGILLGYDIFEQQNSYDLQHGILGQELQFRFRYEAKSL